MGFLKFRISYLLGLKPIFVRGYKMFVLGEGKSTVYTKAATDLPPLGPQTSFEWGHPPAVWVWANFRHPDGEGEPGMSTAPCFWPVGSVSWPVWYICQSSKETEANTFAFIFSFYDGFNMFNVHGKQPQTSNWVLDCLGAMLAKGGKGLFKTTPELVLQFIFRGFIDKVFRWFTVLGNSWLR